MIAMLLGEYAAGHAWTAADAGLRFTSDALVFVAVDDDGGAVGVEDRERPVGERDASRHGLERAFSVLADFEVGNVAHVEGVIGVGIGVARRTRIEMSASRREVGLAFADRVQMNTVETGLETARRDGDVDDRAGALLALNELDLAGDARRL